MDDQTTGLGACAKMTSVDEARRLLVGSVGPERFLLGRLALCVVEQDEILEGRSTPPTDAEIVAHEAAGGLWRTDVNDRMDAAMARAFARGQREGDVSKHVVGGRMPSRWWPTLRGRCWTWPQAASDEAEATPAARTGAGMLLAYAAEVPRGRAVTLGVLCSAARLLRGVGTATLERDHVECRLTGAPSDPWREEGAGRPSERRFTLGFYGWSAELWLEARVKSDADPITQDIARGFVRRCAQHWQTRFRDPERMTVETFAPRPPRVGTTDP